MTLLQDLQGTVEWQSTFPDTPETPREMALRIMTEIVEEMGWDYVYKSNSEDGCYYADMVLDTGLTVEAWDIWNSSQADNLVSLTGACILGRAFYKIGGEELLKELVSTGDNGTGASSVRQYWPDGWANDRGLVQALELSQANQDVQVPYGRVLELFKDHLVRYGEEGAPHHESPCYSERGEALSDPAHPDCKWSMEYRYEEL